MVRSDPFYETPFMVVTLKSYQRQLVDGSDPFYLGVELENQKLSNGSVFTEADLNNPPTAIGGIIDLTSLQA